MRVVGPYEFALPAAASHLFLVASHRFQITMARFAMLALALFACVAVAHGGAVQVNVSCWACRTCDCAITPVRS